MTSKSWKRRTVPAAWRLILISAVFPWSAFITSAARAIRIRWRIEYRRVAYDVEAAARKIVEAGLPPMLAERLFEGH